MIFIFIKAITFVGKNDIMSNIFQISPKELNFEQISQILNKNLKLSLSEASKEKIVKCKKYLDDKMQMQKEPIYGISTGFGSLYKHTISKDKLSQLQKNLLLSHACGTGDEISADIVKLMMLLKIHALALGHSGVQLRTVELIIEFFNRGITPVVFSQGSLGASGDLAPLAHLFLPLLGEGQVYYEGQKYDAADILKKFNLKPIVLEAKEGLALLNGTQFMSAHGVRVIMDAEKIFHAADIIAALSLEAFDGRPEPFLEQLHVIRPHNGQKVTAANFRKILEGSEIITREKAHVQDPYSFRCIPQVHGAAKDAFNHVKSVVLTEINSVTDNPTIFPEDDIIVSGGNFHGEPLALAYDYLAMALSELSSISERRVYRLISGLRGLPEFLVAKPGLNSGFMIPQYAAASIVSQNKQFCSPASVDSIPSSNEQEDHVSMGANAATKLLKVAENTRKVLGIELFNAAQAFEFRRPLKTSDFLEKVLENYRKEVPFVENDILMYPSIHKSADFVNKLYSNTSLT